MLFDGKLDGKDLRRQPIEVRKMTSGTRKTCRPSRFSESGYIDYLLKIGENHGAMVVEAKRKGKLEPATSRVTFYTSPSRVPWSSR